MFFHPGVESMMVILVIGKNRFETWKSLRSDLLEKYRCSHSIIQPRTGDQHGKQQAQGLDQQMPLAPFNPLAAIIAALGTAHLRRLDRLAVDACSAWRGLPTRLPTGLFSPQIKHLCPRAVVAPTCKVVVHGALGKQIVREHIPLTTAPIQIQDRIHHFAHVHFAWASPALGLGRWNHRFQNRPLFVRQIRGIRLPCLLFLRHVCALLYQ